MEVRWRFDGGSGGSSFSHWAWHLAYQVQAPGPMSFNSFI